MRGDDVSALDSVTDSLALWEDSYREERDDVGEQTMLYGRDNEKKTLLEAYQRVKQTGQSEVVFVHGASGLGKTSLVNETLRDEVFDSNGYFCSGKFFQDSVMQEPYSAIMAVFSDLCDLVLQSDDFDSQRQSQIQKDIALDSHLLAGAINLTPFLTNRSTDGSAREYSSSTAAEKSASFARFKAACKAFLRAMTAKNKHILVVFIDDIQWMDEGSEKLINMFIHDKDISNVLFIFSYRDEEETTPAVHTVVRSDIEHTIDIPLSTLSPIDVEMMVSERLSGNISGDIDELSKLVFQRSSGNPFFVALFLDCIQSEQLITFTGDSWNFNVDEIRRSIMVSESKADLLSQKVEWLPYEVRDVLISASLLGYHFSETILLEVLKNSTEHNIGGASSEPKAETDSSAMPNEAFRSIMATAIKTGFLEKTKVGYQFAHDRVQAGFQDLIDEAAHKRLHLIIGEVYLAQESDEIMVYNAAVHLNCARPTSVYNREQRIELALVNLRASRYCQQISAFDKAVYLLREGIDVLTSGDNASDCGLKDVLFDMTRELAKMELMVGNFEACSEATSRAMLTIDSKERLSSIRLIDIECQMAQNNTRESVRTAISALSELGVKMPRKCSTRHIVFMVIKLNISMGSMSHEDIIGLPTVRDENMIVAVRFLMHICLYSLLLDDEATGVYASLVAMDLTLKHGLSPYSATALSMFGIGILRMGNVEEACSLGRLALKLMEQNYSREADSPTIGFVNGMLLHYTEPLRDLRDPLFQAGCSGFDRGDVIYGTYCVFQSLSMDMVLGSHLQGLEYSLYEQHYRITALGQSHLLIWIRPIMQCVANLRNDEETNWHQLASLNGEFMDLDAHLKEARAMSNVIVTITSLMLKAMMCIGFGFYEETAKLFDEMGTMGKVLRFTYAYTVWCCFAADANLELYMAKGKRRYLRKARTFKKALEERKAVGSPNVCLFLEHLDLKECLRVWTKKYRKHRRLIKRNDQDDDALLHRYAVGIAKLSTLKPSYVLAIACTDAAKVAAIMGRPKESEGYFIQAMDAYSNGWGASSPARWLEEKMEQVLLGQKQESVTNPLVGGIVEFTEDNDSGS